MNIYVSETEQVWTKGPSMSSSIPLSLPLSLCLMIRVNNSEEILLESM